MHAVSSIEETPLIGGFELLPSAKGKKSAMGGIYPLAVLSVPRCTTVRMAMTLVNNTGASVTRALAALYGTHDPATGRFTFDFGCVRDGVSIGTGTTTHNVDCHAAVVGTLFDGYAGVGTWSEKDKTFTPEHAIVRTDVLTVTGVTVTGFTLTRV